MQLYTVSKFIYVVRIWFACAWFLCCQNRSKTGGVNAISNTSKVLGQVVYYAN